MLYFGIPPILGPCHELAQGIDLVVVLTIRESEHLCAQLIQPRGTFFQQHLASFQCGGVHTHAHHLVALRLDGPHGVAVPLEGLLQGCARRLVGAFIVTQFSFAPIRIIEYCADLARRAPNVPVYVGLAGPTNPRTLLRYARRCGVSASLRALAAQGMGAVRLFTHTDPGEQLTALAHHCLSGTATNVVGAHLYSFGGVERTAAWMNRCITSRGHQA